MKSKYYVSITIENNQYVGKVFLSTNNSLVYSSKPYNSQDQAMADIRTFVVTSAPPVTDPAPKRTVTTTATYRGLPSPNVSQTGRCCGR
jgi:hypothetical protein